MKLLNVRMLTYIHLSHLGNSFYHVFTRPRNEQVPREAGLSPSGLS